MFKLQGFIEGGVRQDEGLKPPTQISWGISPTYFPRTR